VRGVGAALGLTLAIAALGAVADAAEYEIFVAVESEEELYDLYADGQIDEDTFNTLVELLRRGVDLNRASREDLYSLPNLSYADADAILAYRTAAGFIADPAALVVAGVLSEDKLIAIAPFLVVRDPRTPAFATDGWIRAPTVWAVGDDDGAPPAALQARVATMKDFTFGLAAVLTHDRLGDVVYDPNRMALSAEAPGPRLHLPKFFAQLDTADFGAIAGTYRIGFGQRLTFDNTDRYTPNGFYLDDAIFRGTDLSRSCKESAGELPESPCSGAAGDVYGTPDFRWRDGLRGVAVGARDLRAGTGWMQAYGFFSNQNRSVYQYEIYDRGRCPDPRDDDDPDCSAPYVFKRQDDVLQPTSRFSFHTLPDLAQESLGGANLTYFHSRRAHLGVTGYGATVRWLTEGIDLDFQEWSPIPFGGPYGAVGLDGAWGRGRSDLFVEVARSFDSTPDGGGGLGAVVRTTSTFAKSEVEASVRYYDERFANPYAHPISAPDELDGLRARDELGGRLRYTGVIRKHFSLRTLADVWMAPSTGTPKVKLLWRSDYEQTSRIRWGLWWQYDDKDLGKGGSGQCFEVSTEEDERGEPIPCAGEKIQLTGRLRYLPRRRLSVSAQVQHEWLDDARYPDRMRQDVSGWLSVNSWPTGSLRLRARMRYLFEDISDNQYLEQSLWAYVDAAYRYHKDYRVRLRYDIFVWLDDRESTASRSPAPEHWLWLELETRF
jgi:hypothetical protein